MVLTIEEARQIARVLLGSIQSRIDQPLVLFEPREFAGGWLFAYDSERYIRTGDISDAIGGNGPIAVFRSGNVQILGTSDSLAVHLERLNSGGQS